MKNNNLNILEGLKPICRKMHLTFLIFRKVKMHNRYILDFKSKIKENPHVRFLNTYKKGKLLTTLGAVFPHVKYINGFAGYCCTLEIGE